MKIYQIHGISGAYEDRLDCVIGTYLKKEKAEDECLKLSKQAELESKCYECPIYGYCIPDCKLCDCDDLKCESAKKKYVKKNCPRADLKYDEDHVLVCKNHCDNYYGLSYFNVREYEVLM